MRAHLKAINPKYKTNADEHECKKVFQEGDLVMVHLWCSRFPSIRAKLEKQKFSPFQAARKINDNDYIL